MKKILERMGVGFNSTEKVSQITLELPASTEILLLSQKNTETSSAFLTILYPSESKQLREYKLHVFRCEFFTEIEVTDDFKYLGIINFHDIQFCFFLEEAKS